MSLSISRLTACPLHLSSQGRQGEILEPDAGMKQLRLMPGQDDRPVLAGRRIHVPIRTGMTPSVLQQVAAGVRAKLGQRDALHVVSRLLRQPADSRSISPARQFPSRLDQRLAMPARGTDRFVG